MMMISNFLFSFINFCVIVTFVLTKSPTSGILFSTAVKAVVAAKLVILGILPLNVVSATFY